MKLYKDISTGNTVQDESGLKTIEQINAEFSGEFADITAAFIAEQEAQKAAEELEKNKPENLFSIESFQEGLFGALMQGLFSSPSVRSEFDKICAFATGTKRFAMMKQYLGWLISINCITEQDYGIVASLLMEQNINLENY